MTRKLLSMRIILIFSFLVFFHDATLAQSLYWSTYYGGTSSDQVTGIATTPDSNIYVAGFTGSNNNIATPGAYQEARNNSGQDGFLAKFSANGTRLWATYFYGLNLDRISAVAAYANGDVVIGGYTASTTLIATTGAYQTSINGSFDAFLAKFSSNGTLLWSTYLGGNAGEEINSIAIDELTQDIIVSGTTTSDSIGNKFTGVHKNSLTGLSDIFIAKFTSNGTPKWLSYYGGPSNDYVLGITTDVSGNIYLGGNTFSVSDMATPGAFKVTHNVSQSDGLFAIFSGDGQLKYGTYYGSEVGTDFFNGITNDQKGAVYLVGYGNSSDSVASAASFQTTFGGSSADGYIVKFDTSGNRLWASYLGSTQNDYIDDVTTGPDGKIYIGGHTTSATLGATSDAHQQTYTGATDAFVSCFSAAGNKQWLSYFGGTQLDQIYGIAFNSNNKLTGAGFTNSTSQISTTGAHQTSAGGTNEGFIFSFNTGTIAPVDSSIKNNLIGSDQFLCGSQTASAFIGQLPTGGNGTFSYLWLQSTAGAAGPFLPASGLNTNQNYNAGTPSQTTWYKRMVFSGTQNTESNIVQISIGGNLKAGFTVNGLIQCERNNNFIFTDTTTVPDITTRRWDFGDGNTGSNVIENYSYTFGTVNYFNVKLYLESAGGCKDSITKTVYLIPNPKSNSISGNSNVKRLDKETYTVTANAGYQYQWWTRQNLGTVNNLGSSAEVAWTKSWGTDTLYALEQTGGGCYGDTLMLVVNISPASGEEEINQLALEVFPNPVSTYLQLNFGSNQLHFEIYDMLGMSVMKDSLDGQKSIQVSHLSQGTYIIKVSDKSGNVAFSKFLKIN